MNFPFFPPPMVCGRVGRELPRRWLSGAFSNRLYGNCSPSNNMPCSSSHDLTMLSSSVSFTAMSSSQTLVEVLDKPKNIVMTSQMYEIISA